MAESSSPLTLFPVSTEISKCLHIRDADDSATKNIFVYNLNYDVDIDLLIHMELVLIKIQYDFHGLTFISINMLIHSIFSWDTVI